MSETSTQVLSLALQLPHAERADVAYELLLSLEHEPFDADADAAWQTEIERRLRHFDAGKTAAVDATEALAQVRESLRRQER